MRGRIMEKKTILSGIQATGALTLGNYLGALNNFLMLWLLLYDCRFAYFNN